MIKSDAVLRNIISAGVIFVATMSPSTFYAQESEKPIENPTEFALERIADAVKRDLGLSKDQLRAYQVKERLASDVDVVARADLGEDFAGSYLERNADNTYSVVVAVKSTSTRRSSAIERSDKVKRFQFSLAELQGFEQQILKTIQAYDQRKIVHSIGVLVPENVVEVTVDLGAEVEAQALLQASTVDRSAVKIVGQEARPEATAVLYGGDEYWIYQPATFKTSACSVGFSAYSQTEFGFLTAGHCKGSGSAVTDTSSQPVGLFQQTNFPGSDYAWVKITSGNHFGEPYVDDYGSQSGNYFPVFGNREAPLNSIVCRAGIRTGYRCGYLLLKNKSVFYNNYGAWVYGLNMSDACSGRGDSGGSTFTTAGEAQGIHSGANNLPPGPNTNNCSSSNPRAYYVPLQTALPWQSSYSLRTVVTCRRLTSGYRVSGSGFNVRGSIDGCGTQYKVAINPSTGWATLLQNNSWNYPFAYVGPGGYLEMGHDGNLVARTSSGQEVWASGTISVGAEARLYLSGEIAIHARDESLLRVFCAKTQQFQPCSSVLVP